MENGVLNETYEPGGKTKQAAYKIVCAKLGSIMIVYFLCRLLARYITVMLGGLASKIGQTPANLINTAIIVILLYAIPILMTATVFKSFRRYGQGSGGLRALYKRPKRIASALGVFPAMYGLGYGIALLTLLASYLISRMTGGKTFIEDLLRPTAMEPTSDIAGALTLLFLMVVIAPVLEELWVRGIIYDALEPYGCGMAIIISSVLFGLMHGNLYMLFYTTAFGFALGYIRNVTGSIFITTVLHAIINSVAAGYLFISTLVKITQGEYRLLNTISNIYMLAMLVLIIVGAIAFLKKIPTIMKYKVGNEWTDTGAGRKVALFMLSIPVIIMFVLAFNEHANNWLINLIWRV